MYLAVIFIFILAYDAWKAMWFAGANGVEHFGIGVGTLVLVVNVVLLASYTFGCHSLRHLVGGFLDEPSKRRRAPKRLPASVASTADTCFGHG